MCQALPDCCLQPTKREEAKHPLCPIAGHNVGPSFCVPAGLAEVLRYHEQPLVQAIWSRLAAQLSVCVDCVNAHHAAQAGWVVGPAYTAVCTNPLATSLGSPLARCFGPCMYGLHVDGRCPVCHSLPPPPRLHTGKDKRRWPPPVLQAYFAEQFSEDSSRPLLAAIHDLDCGRLAGALSSAAAAAQARGSGPFLLGLRLAWQRCARCARAGPAVASPAAARPLCVRSGAQRVQPFCPPCGPPAGGLWPGTG